MSESRIKYSGKTDVGVVRDHNEDTFTLIDLTDVSGNDYGVVLMVADGMGGANAGEVASDIACKVVEDRFVKLKQMPDSFKDVEKYLKNLVMEAHKQILKHSLKHSECQGMGTTTIIAWIFDNYLHLVWCGDSRAYVYKQNQQITLVPLSDDHSLVWDMVIKGELTPEEARVHPQSNIILQVLGSADTKPNPSYLNYKLDKGEKILLCSDGLNGMLSDPQIQQILSSYPTLNECIKALIEAARNAGGSDNITVVMGQLLQLEKKPVLQAGRPSSWKKKWSLVIMSLFLLFIVLILFGSPLDKKLSPILGKQQAIRIKEPTTSNPIPQEDQTKITPKSTEDHVLNDQNYDQASNPEVILKDSSETSFAFVKELYKLNQQLDEKTESLEAVNKECDSCATLHETELLELYEVISSTRDHLDMQIRHAEEDKKISIVSKEKLHKLSNSQEVAYDTSKTFGEDVYAEQIYIIITLKALLSKLNTEIDEFTTTPQKIE